MRLYFGTDGVRGKANMQLTAQMAFDIGRYLGHSANGKVLIGKDTRLSGDMLESALVAGVLSTGSDAYLLGVTPTPSVAYLTKKFHFKFGVMISASHNPYEDNGIKIFSSQGIKIPDALEEKIEEVIEHKVDIPYATGDKIGSLKDFKQGLEHYREYLQNKFPLDLSGMKIALDCANGSTSVTAERVFTALNASCTVYSNRYNGVNINVACGSTHPTFLQEKMKQNKFDIGFSFDGDGDRLIAVDSNGDILSGDHILYIVGKYLKENNNLKHNTVVPTVMSNIGFFKACEENDIRCVTTKVGDKYVYEEMLKGGYSLGGEQSGHLIFSEYATTGDGLLSALMLLKVMHDTKLQSPQLAKGLVIYPQLLKNICVEDKDSLLNDSDVCNIIDEVSKQLGQDGRVLVRASGTEPLIRIMVEAKTDALCNELVTKIENVMKRKLN